ncbi:MAG TPA: transglycosylase SLT domain-containing protein [Spirochaetota bacterium]|nr:transglycosylase SLT domain-containing protein [Spirochaetota bacterium]
MTPQRRKKKRNRPNALQIAVVAVGALVFLLAAAFGGYLIHENALYQKALRNYPVAYTELIAQYAAQYELDPYLVQSIMRCESSNDPNAVSGAGAIGLMQIMPDTGAWIAHKLGLDDVYRKL